MQDMFVKQCVAMACFTSLQDKALLYVKHIELQNIVGGATSTILIRLKC